MPIKQFSDIFLVPLSWLYTLITELRNYLFDKKILKSVRFEVPTIVVGNLTVGGTGKTPHIEYLIQLLQYVYRVGTLSRGYGRKSHGFLLAGPDATALTIGDEPMLFKAKYPDTTVAVAEDRVTGIPKLLLDNPEIDVILLDDAYQHRPLRAGLSILLTEYDNLFTRDRVLPAGWLREAAANYHRADILIVSKCPADMNSMEMLRIKGELNPKPYQHVYFTTMSYGDWYMLFRSEVPQAPIMPRYDDILLVTGIANNEKLEHYLSTKADRVVVSSYKDHHNYDEYDLENIRETFKTINSRNKMIVTTEKDAVRLWEHRAWFLQNNIPILVQPMRVEFLNGATDSFNADIWKYIEITRSKTIRQE
jgi:tetraacyldisaccharide 4'-kinase